MSSGPRYAVSQVMSLYMRENYVDRLGSFVFTGAPLVDFSRISVLPFLVFSACADEHSFPDAMARLSEEASGWGGRLGSLATFFDRCPESFAKIGFDVGALEAYARRASPNLSSYQAAEASPDFLHDLVRKAQAILLDGGYANARDEVFINPLTIPTAIEFVMGMEKVSADALLAVEGVTLDNPLTIAAIHQATMVAAVQASAQLAVTETVEAAAGFGHAAWPGWMGEAAEQFIYLTPYANLSRRMQIPMSAHEIYATALSLDLTNIDEANDNQERIVLSAYRGLVS